MEFIQTSSFKLASYSRGDKDSSRLALVLPGRLDTKDYAHMRNQVEYFADKGFYGLSFDPPGTWESPGDITAFTTTNYLKAVNEVIEHFGNRKTVLFGHSRGGAVAMLTSTNPAVERIAMIMATYGKPSSPSAKAVEQGFELELRDLPPGTSKTTEKRKFELPLSYFKDGEQYHPREVLNSFIKPKLLIYGTEDAFTPVERVKEVYAEITGQKMIYELHSEHDYRYHPELFKEINTVMEKFLNLQ
jgi:pimeloyl-ACP methyl ester carboxylesterase